MSPDFNDYPMTRVVRDAEQRITDALAAGTKAYVQQKWTCAHCGSRQTMADKNVFHRKGHCEECDKISAISKCNYLLVLGGD